MLVWVRNEGHWASRNSGRHSFGTNIYLDIVKKVFAEYNKDALHFEPYFLFNFFSNAGSNSSGMREEY